MESRFSALQAVYCRYAYWINNFSIYLYRYKFSRLGELPKELLVMEKERKRLQDDFDSKLIEAKTKLQEAKTESEALLNEMDKTGQAYEEMQEQNIRLIQQVRDKDKEYFSLYQERIKISNLQVRQIFYIKVLS